MKIHVDAKRCELHGQCAFVAPELFQIEGDSLVFQESVPDALRDKAIQAAKVCPQLAIKVTEEQDTTQSGKSSS